MSFHGQGRDVGPILVFPGELESLDQTFCSVGWVTGGSRDLDHEPLQGLRLGGCEMQELWTGDDPSLVLQEMLDTQPEEVLIVQADRLGRDLQHQVLRETEMCKVPETENLQILHLEDVRRCEHVQCIGHCPTMLQDFWIFLPTMR